MDDEVKYIPHIIKHIWLRSEIIMNVFGERLHSLRELKALSQDRLAEITGISQNQISRYERGINDPTGKALVALARALDTTADYLLGLTDDPSGLVLSRRLSAEEIDIVKSQLTEFVNRLAQQFKNASGETNEKDESNEHQTAAAGKA